jgi:hypothetical protein
MPDINDYAAKIPMTLHKLFNSISSTIMHICRNSQRRNSQNELIYLKPLIKRLSKCKYREMKGKTHIYNENERPNSCSNSVKKIVINPFIF